MTTGSLASLLCAPRTAIVDLFVPRVREPLELLAVIASLANRRGRAGGG